MRAAKVQSCGEDGQRISIESHVQMIAGQRAWGVGLRTGSQPPSSCTAPEAAWAGGFLLTASSQPPQLSLGNSQETLIWWNLSSKTRTHVSGTWPLAEGGREEALRSRLSIQYGAGAHHFLFPPLTPYTVATSSLQLSAMALHTTA